MSATFADNTDTLSMNLNSQVASKYLQIDVGQNWLSKWIIYVNEHFLFQATKLP